MHNSRKLYLVSAKITKEKEMWEDPEIDGNPRFKTYE